MVGQRNGHLKSANVQVGSTKSPITALDWWNAAKSFCNIWHHFSCLLMEDGGVDRTGIDCWQHQSVGSNARLSSPFNYSSFWLDAPQIKSLTMGHTPIQLTQLFWKICRPTIFEICISEMAQSLSSLQKSKFLQWEAPLDSEKQCRFCDIL